MNNILHLSYLHEGHLYLKVLKTGVKGHLTRVMQNVTCCSSTNTSLEKLFYILKMNCNESIFEIIIVGSYGYGELCQP
jgi:hypothetical protein